MENNNQQSCIQCHKAVHGRTDKKFCNNTCRNAYNNERNFHENNLTRRIISILRRNRRILRQVIAEYPNSIAHIEALQAIGFQFHYYTETRIGNQRKQTFFCFEYGYRFTRNNQVKVIYQKNKL